MDDTARLKLQEMIKANNVSDQTETIRSLKHSSTLRENVNTMILLKNKHKNNLIELNEEASRECYFLYANYTDIYNKIKKDEIDLVILFQFLDVLEKIECGELDQHEGSFEVGTLLKKIYVDSALRKADKLNDARPEIEKNAGSSITWKQFKMNVESV
jgi:hypothetical protein